MGIELFERAADANAQLLEALVCAESGDAAKLSLLLLTFDVGRILIRPDPERESFSIEVIAAGAPLPPGLVNAAEEDPWWRLLGSPLARVWEPEGALHSRVCLQFRADGQSPRVVTLEAQGASVSIRLENPPD